VFLFYDRFKVRQLGTLVAKSHLLVTGLKTNPTGQSYTREKIVQVKR